MGNNGEICPITMRLKNRNKILTTQTFVRFVKNVHARWLTKTKRDKS